MSTNLQIYKFTNFNWFSQLDSFKFLKDESRNKIRYTGVVPQVNIHRYMNCRQNVRKLFFKNIKC